MRSLLAAIIITIASTASAQVNIWSMNQGIQNQYNQAYAYQTPYYYAPPVYYATTPYYGGGYYDDYEIRQLRYSIEDASFQRRWQSFNNRGWRR